MARYLLHIGLPKTGTKYLQANFRRLRSVLAERGVIYPADWWREEHEVNHDRLAEHLRTGNIEALRPIFDRLNASDGTVLLSCEGLSGFNSTELARLHELMNGNIPDIILYCRRWSDWIPSAWQQVVKEGGHATLPEYVAETLQQAYGSPAINLSHIVKTYTEVFKAGNLRIFSYSNLADAKLDIGEEFFRTALHWESAPPMHREPVHESLGTFQTELVRLLNSLRRRRGAPSEVTTRRLLEIALDRADLRALADELVERMHGSVAEIEINDASPGLRGLFADLNDHYGKLLHRQTADQKLFAPRRNSVTFVQQDYLADPNAASAAQRILAEMQTLDRLALPNTFDVTELRRFTNDLDAPPTIRFASGGRAADYLASHPVAGAPREGVEVNLDAAFGASEATHTLLRGGWSQPEARFVWSQGTRAELRLERPVSQRNYAALLVFRAFTRDTRLPFQHVEISVNGHDVGNIEVFGYIVAEMHLPWRLLAGRPEIEFTVDLPKAARPADFGGSKDQRQLALSLERVVLYSHPPIHSAASSTAHPGAWIAAGPVQVEANDAPKLFERFESLGENCEFGLVQRRCGIEPLGLLRFSSTPLSPLLNALRGRFAGMGRPEFIEIEVSQSGTEYMVFDKRFHFRYHAWVKLGEQTPEEIHARECRRLPLLVRKLIEDLSEGTKIFVYRGMEPLTEAQARELAAAIGAYGPGTLLWVERADAANPPGTVIRLGPTLLKGHIDRFAPPENAHDLSLDCWVTLCRNALAMTRETVAA
ncbi:MAG: hypothetical protein J0I21_09280 [Alphaproteobacteria bacterium]|nr:hypothetical protein [Alphaproteobacteria bacterium]